MKKCIKFLSLLLLFVVLFTSFACGEEKKQEVTVENVSVVTETVPSSLLTTEVSSKITEIQIKVLKSDDTEEIVNVNKSMISSSDLDKLATEGLHKITINYEGFSLEVTINVKKPEEVEVKKDPIPYSVYFEDIAGKPLSGFYVTFYLEDERVAEGYSNNDGIFKVELVPNIYEVIVEGKDGYYLNQEKFTTDLMGSVIEVECELGSLAGIEADQYHSYSLGDVMYDFTVVDTEGNSITLYDLLETKKAVVLNFWYTTCSACYYEFPYMVDAYDMTYVNGEGETVKYSDDIAIIAINPGIAGDGDTIEEIIDFKESMGLNFSVCLDYDSDTSNLLMEPALTTMFGVTAYPTTIIIDQYGLVAEIGVGAVTATEKWTQAFDTYVDEDYVPTFKGEVDTDDNGFIKPDIVQEESSVLEEAINGTNYDGSKFNGTWTPEEGEKDKDSSWPWVVDEYNGKTAIRPSNKDVHYSFATVYTTVHLKAGEVFTFNYFSSTEEYDMLYVTVNSIIGTYISGISPDWESSYAYVAIEEGDYEFGFCYLKDQSYSHGDDAVYITNVRVVTIDDIDKETYIYRECADGKINEFTMSYSSYATVVYNENDGYYHVNDENGPLLFADMLSGTRWNQDDLYTISLQGLCIGADGVDYTKLIEEYSVYASNSEIAYTPVTKELADGLKQVVKALGDERAVNNPNQWLEVCVYYSAYYTGGVELGVPTVGVCPWEPIEFDGDGISTPAKAEATFNRIILPRGYIFGFTPTKSGVYKFYGTEEELQTLCWICDEDANALRDGDNELRIFAKNATNGIENDQNFIAYVYMEAGKTYLYRAAFEDIYEYSTITVEMSYVCESLDLLTLASPGVFTTSDDAMTDIIAGNYVDLYLGEDGYYHVKDSRAKDDLVYCDVTYLNNILTGYTLLEALSDKFNAFDFSKDEFGYPLFDENGYRLFNTLDENYQIVTYYICYDAEGNEFYTSSVNEGEYTEENGYTYAKLTEEEMEAFKGANCTEYVKEYINSNMITDENSELYGCVKVDERFSMVLSMLMAKYTFDVEYGWAKLCYYYRYVGA